MKVTKSYKLPRFCMSAAESLICYSGKTAERLAYALFPLRRHQIQMSGVQIRSV